MTNVNRPAGLLPVRHAAGGMPQRLGAYTIADELAEDIYSGDPVDLTGTGRNISLATAGDGNPIVGVFAGVRYVDSNGEQQFRPRWPSGTTATEIEAYVYDDPLMQFVIQVNDSTGLAEADVGQMGNLVAGTGNNFTGRSGWQLDKTSGFATTVTHQVRILGLARMLDNDYGQYAKALVMIQRHRYGQQPSAGV